MTRSWCCPTRQLCPTSVSNSSNSWASTLTATEPRRAAGGASSWIKRRRGPGEGSPLRCPQPKGTPMSVAHLVAVFDLDEPVGAARAVLLVLAEHANAATGECWPSEARIARRAGVHPATVRRCMRTLEDDGLVVVQRSPGKVNRYLLLIDVAPVAKAVDPAHQARGRAQKPRAPGAYTTRVRLGDPEREALRTVKNLNEPQAAADGLAAARAALEARTA